MPFVLDNSVAVAWMFENQATPYSEAVAVRLQRDRAQVPTLWELEFTNVLRTACIRGRFDGQRAQVMLEQVLGLPIATQDADLMAAAVASGAGVLSA